MNTLREIGLFTLRCIDAALRNPIFMFMGIVITSDLLGFFYSTLRHDG